MSADYYQHPAYPSAAYPVAPSQGQQTAGGMAQVQHPGTYYVPQGAPMQMAAPAYPQQQSSSLLGFTNDRFIKGLLIGAAAAYILSNESVQRTAIKGAVKAWSLVQGGLEEVKERFHDAEAELHAAEVQVETRQDADER